MKTLNQVEPRIPLDVAHIATAADSEFVIKNAGSYYLTGNLTVSKTNGIRVAVAGVTVDLNGFQVTRAGAPSGNGIVIDSVAHRCTIKHGTLSGFAAGTAVAQSRPRGGTFESLKATGNVTGLTGGDGWRLDHCIATDNNGLTTIGIAAGIGSAVVDCTSYDNGNIGFLAEAGTSFTRCIATGNGGVGFIDLSPDAVMDSCLSESNGGDGVHLGDRAAVRNCSANGNGSGGSGSGIVAQIRATITGCIAMANQQDGISVEGDSVITYNHVSDNGKSPSAYATGIHVSGAGSHIEGNQVRDNSGTGILATTADVIVRNSVGNNFTGNMATNFDPTSGSNFAPIQTPATATNPFANISY